MLSTVSSVYKLTLVPRSIRALGQRLLSTSDLIDSLEKTRGASLEERTALAERLSPNWMVSVGEARATSDSGESLSFLLQVAAKEDRTDLGLLRAALFAPPSREARADGHLVTALLFGLQCHPALPLALAGQPLIDAVRAELHNRGVERVMAIAPLPGLCQWIVNDAGWERLRDSMTSGFHEEQPGAVEAVARGMPFPGHSVLEIGTYNTARPAFESLAQEYAQRAGPDSEVSAYVAAGAELAGIHWMHDTSEEALRDRAGCTAGFEFGLYAPV